MKLKESREEDIMSCWMGIDSGTSGIKAVIINEKGDILGMGYCEQDVVSPLPGYAEQDPYVWWRTCDKAVKEAVRNSGGGKEICAIGFSGQQQGTVFLDKDGKPIRNCIIWMDQRAVKEVKEIEDRLAAAGIDSIAITGNTCLTSYWAPKILWVKNNEPENYERIDKILFPKDYLSYRMTGEMAIEVSDASCSFLLDLPNRRWSDDMFKLIGIPRSFLPERLMESCGVVGELLKSVADEWGLKPGIPVIAGGGDQPANGIGSGIIDDGLIGTSIGTSAVIFGAGSKPFLDKKKRAIISHCHAVPNKWAFVGLSLTAGASLKWLRDVIFEEKKEEYKRQGKEIYDYITGLAAQAKTGCEGLVFLPYFNGDSTPNNDPHARACFFGMSLRTGINEICRSVMEGVAFSLRDSIEICREMGIDVPTVRVSGGGAKSRLWRQIQADIFNASIVNLRIEEGPAVGAVIMAATGSGYFKDIKEGCDSIVRTGEVIDPVSENVKIYEEYYQTYKNLYIALKKPFADQAEIVSRVAHI